MKRIVIRVDDAFAAALKELYAQTYPEHRQSFNRYMQTVIEAWLASVEGMPGRTPYKPGEQSSRER